MRLSIFTILLCLLIPACNKKPKNNNSIETIGYNSDKNELDFLVKNGTHTKVYVTCFYYAVRETGVRWQWYKTPVYELDPGAESMIDVHTMKNFKDSGNVYAYLGVFRDKVEAENSIFELLKEQQRVDLKKLVDLKDHRIVLETEKYGFKGLTLDSRIENDHVENVPELDFLVRNDTERDLFITCFVYQRDTNHPQWIFDKTEVIELRSGEEKLVDVDTLVDGSDRESARGYLGVFENDEKQLAEDSIFELLKPDQKLNLGILSRYRNKVVTIIPKYYGALAGFDGRHPYLEYTTNHK